MSAPTLHQAAAFGDGQAFAQLAAAYYNRALQHPEARSVELTAAVVYARLAAIRTNERPDWVNFIYLLDAQAVHFRETGQEALADRAHGEAVALAEFMAINGDDEMSQMIVASAEQLSPGALKMARQLNDTVTEALSLIEGEA